MPALTNTLQNDGALVEISLGPSQVLLRKLRLLGRPIPMAVRVQALIDTGAETSSIAQKAIDFLGLPVKSAILVNAPTVGGWQPAAQYDVRLAVVHPSGNASLDLVVDPMVITELAIGPLGYQALLGRDVLAICRFVFDGRAGQFELAY